MDLVARVQTQKKQEQLNETIKYLIQEKNYCGKCAFQALAVTANATSIS